MARVLVTGGSGFIGTNLIDSFLEDSWQVSNFDRTNPRDIRHEPLLRKGDIRDATALTSAMRDFRPDYVVHLAARTDLDRCDSGQV